MRSDFLSLDLCFIFSSFFFATLVLSLACFPHLDHAKEFFQLASG